MKRKSYGKKILSVCLVCAMIFTSTDWSQAAGWLREISAGQEVKKSQEKQVVLSESAKNATTFQLADGKKQTVFYGQDVRFENEDGKLTDYDPSLVKIKEIMETICLDIFMRTRREIKNSIYQKISQRKHRF